MEDKRISEYDNLEAADIEDTDLLEVGRPSIKNFKLTWANLRLAVINFLSDILLGKEDVSNKKIDLTDNSDTFYVSQKAVKTAIDSKQDKLVSGTNIKTINSNTLLGSGNVEVPQNLDDLLDIPEHPGVADKILNTKSSGYEWVDRPTDFGIIGEIKLWTSDTLPSAKWLICNGAAISRTTYSALFNLIGTTYGAGDGSTTFNIPDLRGNVPVGKSTDTEFDTLGKKGGEKTHKLTVAELAAHSHNTPSYGGSGNNQYFYLTKETASGYTQGYDGERTSIVGGDQPHNNLQPYITLNYIIKAL